MAVDLLQYFAEILCTVRSRSLSLAKTVAIKLLNRMQQVKKLNTFFKPSLRYFLVKFA